VNFIHADNLIESALVSLITPNLIESHPVIDTHDNNLIVSALVFNKPCLIESQEESLMITGGITSGEDSFLEQA
jgi:hypothetical protein